jgi:hypothetical protein
MYLVAASFSLRRTPAFHRVRTQTKVCGYPNYYNSNYPLIQ